MQAVTITQISAPELESIIENSIYGVLAKQTKNDSKFDEFLSVEVANFSINSMDKRGIHK